MSFGIIRMSKFKASGLSGIEAEIERAKEKNRDKPLNRNPDIRCSDSHLNYTLCSRNDNGLRDCIMSRIHDVRVLEEKKLGKPLKKLRKDAVVACGFIVTSDKDFFEKLDAASSRKFFQSALDFLKKRYGAENVVSATVHMDETTPHMHVFVVPERDGQLSAKSIFNLKTNELQHLQDDFYADVCKGWGLQRGERKNAEHITKQRYELEKARDAQKQVNVEYQSKRKYVAALAASCEPLQPVPSYAQVKKKSLFRRRDMISMPLEKWEELQRSMSSEKIALEHATTTFEQKVGEFNVTTSARRIGDLEREIKAANGQINNLQDENIVLKAEKLRAERKLEVFQSLPEDIQRRLWSLAKGRSRDGAGGVSSEKS